MLPSNSPSVEESRRLASLLGRWAAFLYNVRTTRQPPILAQSPSGATITGRSRMNSFASTRRPHSSAILLSASSSDDQLGCRPVSSIE